MRALWLENQAIKFRSDLPVPDPIPGTALVRVRLAGICSTDLELLQGYYPFSGITGHEFVGQVVSAPDEPAWVGRRVVGEINLACGACAMCLGGNPKHCEARKVLGIRDWHGAFAEYLVLPLQNLYQVPEWVADENAVFTEPLAAALEILEQVPVLPEQRWLMVGAGRLGQLIARVLAIKGCSLRVVARHPYQRRLLDRIGVTWVSEDNIDPDCAEVVVEATGTPAGFELARRAVRPRGTIVLKSTYQGDMVVNFSSIVVDEITLVGSRCGPFASAIQLLARGEVDFYGLIQASYPLEQGEAALRYAALPGVLKVLLSPQAEEEWIRKEDVP